jgi:hypothetical protein
MTGDTSLPSLKSFVGKIVEAKSTSVKRSGLFSVTHPKGDMV